MSMQDIYAVVVFENDGVTLAIAQHWLLANGIEAKTFPTSPSIGIHPLGQGEKIRVDLMLGEKVSENLRRMLGDDRFASLQPGFDAFFFVAVREIEQIQPNSITLPKVLQILREKTNGQLIECW